MQQLVTVTSIIFRYFLVKLKISDWCAVHAVLQLVFMSVYAVCRGTSIQVSDVCKSIQPEGSSADTFDETHRRPTLSV